MTTPPLPCSELLTAADCVAYLAGLDGAPAWTSAAGWGSWKVFDLDREALEAALQSARLDLRYRVWHDGRLRWIADRAERREVEGQPRWVGAWRDVSEAQERARLDLALARLAAWAQLGSGLAHEVNNQLAGVLNYAELALRLPNPDARYRESLEAIASEGARIRAVTEGVRALPSRAAHEDYAIDPAQLLRGLLAPLRRSLRERLIALELEAPPGLLPARGQGYALQGALVELLDNAVAACGQRGTLRLEARNEEDGDDLVVVFEVRDTGPGIDDVDRARTRFFSTRPGAAGLGLTLAERWAAELGGALRLSTSRPGGTLAELTVPTA